MTEKEEFQSFWDLLVPPKGKAETVQGEVIRIAGRIEYEFLDNGCINWDEDFKKMLDAFLRYVQLGNGFSGDDLSSAELLVHLLKDNGDKGFIKPLSPLSFKRCTKSSAELKSSPLNPLPNWTYLKKASNIFLKSSSQLIQPLSKNSYSILPAILITSPCTVSAFPFGGTSKSQND